MQSHKSAGFAMRAVVALLVFAAALLASAQAQDDERLGFQQKYQRPAEAVLIASG